MSRYLHLKNEDLISITTKKLNSINFSQKKFEIEKEQ